MNEANTITSLPKTQVQESIGGNDKGLVKEFFRKPSLAQEFFGNIQNAEVTSPEERLQLETLGAFSELLGKQEVSSDLLIRTEQQVDGYYKTGERGDLAEKWFRRRVN